LDAAVLAISADRPEQSREIAEAYGFDFPLLSDPKGRVIDEFGLRHPDGGIEGDIARPALFVLDRDGRIAWRHLTDNWRVRVRPEQVLEQVAALP
jgi:peroxiredoxin